MTPKEKEDNWVANYIQCDLCSHKWVAVYPLDLDRLECNNCNNMVIFKNL